jgi:hypothetical protein
MSRHRGRPAIAEKPAEHQGIYFVEEVLFERNLNAIGVGILEGASRSAKDRDVQK